jgi:hypothetical protein
MRRTILTALIWVALGGAAQAEKVGYQCAITGALDGQWIQPLIFIAIDRKTDRVIVSDAAILVFNDGVPVDGRVIKENAARITFGWQVEMQSSANQRVKMDYRATYVKSSGKVNVSAHPRGYEGFFNRGGTCKVKPLQG